MVSYATYGHLVVLLCLPPLSLRPSFHRCRAQKGLEAELNARMATVAGLHPSTSPSGKQLGLLRDLTRKQDKKASAVNKTPCLDCLIIERCDSLFLIDTHTQHYLLKLKGRVAARLFQPNPDRVFFTLRTWLTCAFFCLCFSYTKYVRNVEVLGRGVA